MDRGKGAALFLVLTSLLLVKILSAQPGEALLDQRSRWNDTRALMQMDTLPPMGFKPWDAETLGKGPIPNFRQSDSSRSLLFRKLFQEELLRIEEGPLTMSIDPLFDLEWGKDFADPTEYGDTTTLYRNQRGFHVQGRIGERISFSSRFRESQVFLPRYLRDYTQERGVVPGQGRYKPFEGNGFDHSIASGKIGFEAADWLAISLGHGKQFIGEGYRSLFLSDNAFNHPFLELKHRWWNGKIAYRNLYTGFMSLERMPKGDAPEALFKPKAGTFHYLDIRLLPWIRLGLFEGIIRKRWDSTGRRPIEPRTLSPVIFTNTLLEGFDAEHNVLTGADLRARVNEHLLLYGQFILDDPKAKEYGHQVGVRGFDLGMEGFDVLMEFNHLMPGTFTHRDRLQHYGHYGQPLAHPLGMDLEELVARADLDHKRFFLRLAYSYARIRGSGNSNILPGRSLAQSPRDRLQHQRVSLGYLVNPKNRSEFSVSLRRRILRTGSEMQDDHETLYFSFSFKTSLSNSYWDL